MTQNYAPQAKITQSFGTPFVATVADGGGNLLDGIPVTFSAPPNLNTASGTFTQSVTLPPPGSAGATSATVLTDPGGVATAPPFFADMVLTPAGYHVSVGTSTLTVTNQITLTNLVGDPSRVAFTTPAPTQFGTDVSVSNIFTATVFDLGSNRVPSAVVTYTSPANTALPGGNFGPPFTSQVGTSVSDGSGVAVFTGQFKPNCHLGSYPVQASAQSPLPVQTDVITLTNVVGGPAQIAIQTGDGQNATVANHLWCAFESPGDRRLR